MTGKILLAHLASHQGVAAVEIIAGNNHAMDYKAVPACTYTHPEVASVGLSEKKARDAGDDVRMGCFPFQAAAPGLAWPPGRLAWRPGLATLSGRTPAS